MKLDLDLPPHRSAYDVLSAAIEAIDPSHVFAMFSGGHDSLSSTSLAASHLRFTAAVHVNTGIGIEETREYVRDRCAEYGWPLIELKASECKPKPMIYEDIVRRYGFPGPQQHLAMYTQLKERCIRQLIREHAIGNRKIMLVTGVRRLESSKRMGKVVEVQHEGRRVWVAPILNWDNADIDLHIESRHLTRNPVKQRLCISGECLCGAFAKPGERAEIKYWYPNAFAEIDRIEAVARDAGVWSKWGEKPPTITPENAHWKMMMCSSCLSNAEDLDNRAGNV